MTENETEHSPEEVEEALPEEEEVLEKSDELSIAKEEVKEFKDKYLRLLAESENARKRLIREREDLVQYAMQDVIADFLHPIDQMESALKCAEKMSEEVNMWARGFKMILGHFKDVLSNRGVHSFESEGKAFDPHLHEAVETEENEEHPPETVLRENVRGYKMGDRVIRPARVVVTKTPRNNDEKNQQQGEESHDR